MSCHACGSIKFKQSLHGFFACQTCGLVQFSPYLKLEERVAELKELGQVEDDGARAPEGSDKEHKAGAFRCIFKGFNAFRGLGDNMQGTRGLCFEVGFGNGHMMEEAKHLGWRVDGCDASDKAVSSARKRGLSAIVAEFDEMRRVGDIMEVDMPDHLPMTGRVDEYDLIWAWDSFEHMKDLNKSFENVTHLLKSKGTFVMSSPNVNLYRADKDHPHWLDRSHLWHMTPEAAQLMAERAGIEVLRILTGRGEVWVGEQYAHPQNFVLWGKKK